MRNIIIASLLVFQIIGCSKQDNGTVNSVTNPTGPSSKDSGTVVKLSKIEDRIKAEAKNLKAGIGSEEAFINAFNEFLSATNDQDEVVKKARTLQEDLIEIFNDRLNLYLNLLNSSLEGKQASIKIDFRNNDPQSAKMALQALYTSLSSRKLRTKLTLADQYLVFDITILLKEKFSVLNQETVPETKIADFLKTMVNDNIRTPQEAFYAYQIAHRLLQSDFALFTTFHPIIAKIKINEKSNYNEIELYKRLSSFASKEKHVTFLNSKEDTVNFFKNVDFIAKNSVEKINSLGVDQNEAFFKNLDLAFNIHTAYLAIAAEKNRMDILELSKIQDNFIESTYLTFIKSLNDKPTLYLDLFKGECKIFQSKELDLILKNFLLITDTKKETSCVYYIKEKIQKNDYTYLDDFQNSISEENAKFNNVIDVNIKNYFKQYNATVLGNWILNIFAKNVNHDKFTGANQVKVYNVYQNSKLSLMNVLKLRELNGVNVLDKAITTEGLNLKAGIYTGNINTKQTIYLHPLAIIVPDRDSTLEITSEGIVGGRIDTNYIKKDYSQVLNAHLNQTVSKGTVPTQNAQTGEVLSRKTTRERCNNPGRHSGGDGGCADAASTTTVLYRYSKNANDGVSPAQAYIGEKGISAKSVILTLTKRSIFETTILSIGEKGFRGNQGLNAPRCNQANEYQRFYGRFYSFTCSETDGDTTDCRQKNSSAESSSQYLNELVSLAGKSGDGGEGGNGGRVIVRGNIKSSYPGLSLGGIGGEAGLRASCIYPSQSSDLDGANGKLGQNGRVEII